MEKGVVINGVKWATRNVDNPDTFVANPEDSGKFYQWNRKTAWASTGDVTNWDNRESIGDTWEKSNDPSPIGWRVPTAIEIDSLLDYKKVAFEFEDVNGVNGMKFTDKVTGNSIFLPAVGARLDRGIQFDFRRCNGGELDGAAGYSGSYWSSTANGNTNADTLVFGMIPSRFLGNRNCGKCIRSVAE